MLLMQELHAKMDTIAILVEQMPLAVTAKLLMG